MENFNLNESLMKAVEVHDVPLVRKLLDQGANPNFTRHSDEEEPNGYLQPTSPLRMVLFCISDSMLSEEGLKDFSEIAKLLIKSGADPKPAMQIAEYRYGKYDPNAKGLFMDVWHIVANAQ